MSDPKLRFLSINTSHHKHTSPSRDSATFWANFTHFWPFLHLHTPLKFTPSQELMLLELWLATYFTPEPCGMEGIRAQQHLPTPPSRPCISSFTYANYFNGESLQGGSQKQELCSSNSTKKKNSPKILEALSALKSETNIKASKYMNFFRNNYTKLQCQGLALPPDCCCWEITRKGNQSKITSPRSDCN